MLKRIILRVSGESSDQSAEGSGLREVRDALFGTAGRAAVTCGVLLVLTAFGYLVLLPSGVFDEREFSPTPWEEWGLPGEPPSPSPPLSESLVLLGRFAAEALPLGEASVMSNLITIASANGFVHFALEALSQPGREWSDEVIQELRALLALLRQRSGESLPRTAYEQVQSTERVFDEFAGPGAAWRGSSAVFLNLAIKQWQKAGGHAGLPPTLGALVPDFLEAIPIDPFSGRPFGYDAERRFLWSVGADGVDSGGKKPEDFSNLRFELREDQSRTLDLGRIFEVE